MAWFAWSLWTFSFSCLQVAGQSVVWSYQSGSTAQDWCNAVAVDPNSKDVVIGGATAGGVHGNSKEGNRDWVAIKLDKDGALQWTYQAGEHPMFSEVFGVAIDTSSNVVLVGQHEGNLFGTGIGDLDIAVVMLNAAGVQQWSTQQGSTADDVATCVVIDSSGNIVVGGFMEGPSSVDPVLLKLNSAGVQQWLMTTELATSGNDSIYGLTTDDSDRIFVTGHVGAAFDSNTYYGGRDAFILKTDSAGAFQWSYQIGSAQDDAGTGIAIANGDVYAAGNTLGSLPGYTNLGSRSDGFIVKLNAAGVQQWLFQIGTSSEEVINGLAVHPSGHIAIYGATDGDFNGDTNAGGEVFLAAGYDSDGALEWSYLYGNHPGKELFYGGAYDADGDLVLAGRANSQVYSNSEIGNYDLVAVKLSPPSFTTTSKSTTSTSISSATTVSTASSTVSRTRTTSTTGTATGTWSFTATATSSTVTSTGSTSMVASTGTTSWTDAMSSLTSTSSLMVTDTSTASSVATSGTSRTVTARSSTSSAVRETSTTSTVTRSTTSLTVTATSTTSWTATARSTTSWTTASNTSPGETTPGETQTAVARLETAESFAVQQILGQLNSTQLAVTVETALGVLKVASVLAGAGGMAVDAESVKVEVSAETVEEILLAVGLNREDPLLFSVLAMNESASLETSRGESVVLSSALSFNFWRSDGTRIEVKDLVKPLQFTLQALQVTDAKCAFWNEETGNWSTDGVTTLASSNGSIACSTSHLTIFAGIKDVFLANVALAFKCSTISSLLSGPAFAKLRQTAWLWSSPSILNLTFHGLGAVCILLAWLYDRKQEKTIPWEERELFLMQVKDDEAEGEEDDGDAPPPSRWTRCMGCCRNAIEYVSHVTGGDATVEALKEMVGNADTAAVNRAISTIQSHKARVARAQIAIFNKLQLKETVEEEEEEQSNRRTSRRSSLSSASEVVVAETLEKAVDLGQSAATAFLQRGWLCRVAALWPALHPCLKAMQFSMLAPVRASVALLVLKITSAGALGAVFFSSSSPGPDSDPDCFPRKGAVEQVIQSLTVGFVTALLSDVIVSILFTMQVKRVVFSTTEWTEKKKRRQRFRWSMRTLAFWLILLLYGTFCELYICLFLANVTETNRREWLQSLGVTLLNDLLLKSFLTAFILATIASLVLCCRPQVVEKVQAKWIKDKDDTNEGVPEHTPEEFELSNGTDMLYFANFDIESPGFGKSRAEKPENVSSDAFQEESV